MGGIHFSCTRDLPHGLGKRDASPTVELTHVEAIHILFIHMSLSYDRNKSHSILTLLLQIDVAKIDYYTFFRPWRLYLDLLTRP